MDPWLSQVDDCGVPGYHCLRCQIILQSSYYLDLREEQGKVHSSVLLQLSVEMNQGNRSTPCGKLQCSIVGSGLAHVMESRVIPVKISISRRGSRREAVGFQKMQSTA
jgi:hypothetical protein